MRLFKNTLVIAILATMTAMGAEKTMLGNQSWYDYTKNKLSSNFLESNITKDMISSIGKPPAWQSRSTMAKAKYLSLDVYDKISKEDLAEWAKKYKETTGRDPEEDYDGEYKLIKDQIIQYIIENAYPLGLVGEQAPKKPEPASDTKSWYDYTKNKLSSNFLESTITKDTISSIEKPPAWQSRSTMAKAKYLSLDIYDKISKEDLAEWAKKYKEIIGRDPEEDYDNDYKLIKDQIMQYIVENAYQLGLVG